MIEQLQQKLIEWVEKTSDLLSEQLPDFALQIVAYKMWSATIAFYLGLFFFIISLLTMITFLIYFFSCNKELKSNCFFCKTDTEVFFKGFLWMLFISLGIGILTFKEYAVIKKCEVAPKIVILDYLRKLND